MSTPTMKPSIGQRLRFFSNRVFGAWVDATLTAVDRRTGTLTLRADYYGNTWTAKKHVTATFFFPSGHPNSGEEFRFRLG